MFQGVKEKVNRIFEALVVLAYLHSVQHFYQRGKVLFVCRGLVVDVANQRRVKQRFSLDPEIVTGFAFALGVGDKRGDDFQYILFVMDIGKGVKVHGFREVDRIEYPDLIRLIDDLPMFVSHRFSVLIQLRRASLKELSAFHQHRTLWICYNIATVHLHQVRLDEKSRFTAAGTANDQYILVSGIGRILRSAGHHKPFGLRKNDVILRPRVHKGGNIRFGAP